MSKRRSPSQRRSASSGAAKSGVRVRPERERRPPDLVPDVERIVAAPIRGRELGLAAAVGLLALLVYLRTIHPSLPTGDSGELITAAYVGGVAHPPGYPLYMMLGHLATLLPVGSPALAMNLLSAVLDAATIAVMFIVIYRLVGASALGDRGRRNALVAATVGSLILAFSTVFWMYSIVAEVFALNNLFAALLLLVGLEWERRPQDSRLLFVFAFLFGLALTNQLTIVLLAPAFLALGWSSLARLRRGSGGRPLRVPALPFRDVALAGGLSLVGMLPYAYLPLAAARDPSMNWGDPDTFERFLSLVLRADYGTFRLAAQDLQGSIPEHLGLLAANLALGFVYAGIALAALGLLWMARHRPGAALALALAFLFSGPLFVAYANVYIADALTKGVVERFYILPSIPVAVLAGAGAVQLLAWAERATWPRVRPNLVPSAVAIMLLALPVGAMANNFATVDQSGNEVAIHYAEDVLGPLEPNAMLLMRSDENYTTISYAQLVAGFRPDVVALDVELLKLESTVSRVRRQHPAIVIPFDAYDGGRRTSISQLVAANIGSRPVYYVGVMEEKDFGSGFDQLRAGFARRLLPSGQAPDAYRLLRDHAPTFASLRFPRRTFAQTTWEAVIARAYGAVASDIAFAIQSANPQGDLALAEQMYRTAIRLAPNQPANYKNLGVLLRDRGGDPGEIVSLWERFLELDPDDPSARAIRAEVERLRASL